MKHLTKDDRLRTGDEPKPYRVGGQPVAFTQDYRGGDRYHMQFAKGADMQWQVADRKLFDWDSEIDFGKPVTPDAMSVFHGTALWNSLSADGIAELRRDMLAEQLSQFLHGEQGALKVTGQLVAAVPGINAQLAAGLQVGDEARHVEFMRHALARVGKSYPVNPALQELIDQAMVEESAHLKFISMQLLIEGLALAAFGTIRHALEAAAKDGGGDALLHAGLLYIIRDESRHVALGMDMLKTMLGPLNDEQRDEAAAFVYDGFRLMRDRLVPKYVCEQHGIDPKTFYSANTSSSLVGYQKSLIKGVLPKALILGLVPERYKGYYTAEFSVDWDLVGKSATKFESEP